MSDDQMRVEAEKRREEIRGCGFCDESGWSLGTDGLPTEPARRCTHQDRPEGWWDR